MREVAINHNRRDTIRRRALATVAGLLGVVGAVGVTHDYDRTTNWQLRVSCRTAEDIVEFRVARPKLQEFPSMTEELLGQPIHTSAGVHANCSNLLEEYEARLSLLQQDSKIFQHSERPHNGWVGHIFRCTGLYRDVFGIDHLGNQDPYFIHNAWGDGNPYFTDIGSITCKQLS